MLLAKLGGGHLGVVAVWLLVARGAQPEIRHVSPSPDEAFLACASKLLGKPTLRHGELPWVGTQVPCGADREAFLQALRAKELMVTDAGSWAVIHYTKSKTDPTLAWLRDYAWNRLQVVRVIEHQPHPAHGLPLSDAQVREIGDAVIAVARPVPVSLPPTPTDGDLLQLELRVTMDRVRMGPGVDAVVTLTGFERTGRFVYGELRNGRYVPLWDSPMLGSVGGPNLSWTYRDLDGDGVLEILAYGAAHPNYETLVVFDVTGRELTRNHECYVVYGELTNTNPTCPLIGETIRFEPVSPERPFPLAIVTETRDGAERFCWQSGVYALCRAPK